MPRGKSWGALAVSVGLGLLPETSRAQEVEEAEALSPPRTVVLLHPVNRLGVGVERAVGSHVALAASLTTQFFVSRSHLEPPSQSQTGSWGVGLDPGVHVYLAGRAPEGFWVGAHLEAELFWSNSRSTIPGLEGPQEYVSRSSLYSLGGSARVGYTAILSPGLTLQAGLGLGVLETRSYAETAGTSGGVSSGIGLLLAPAWAVAPRLSFGLGWAF